MFVSETFLHASARALFQEVQFGLSMVAPLGKEFVSCEVALRGVVVDASNFSLCVCCATFVV